MKFVKVFLWLIALGLAGTATTAFASGGHNETSELNATGWSVGAPTLGTAAGLSGTHLLISEIIVTPTTNEAIEIHNPTSSAVDLTNYYVTDAWFSPSPGTFNSYHLLPSGLTITTNTDFCMRFPSGASIPAGGTIVVGLYGPGIDSTYGAGTVDYEITSVSPSIPDMINVGNNLPVISAGATTLTNGSEFVMLFYWDGSSDNVCDIDYVTWGTSTGTSRVDKTGLSVDGPDGDAIATAYSADTPILSQSNVTSPGSGSSVARNPGPEGTETAGGNGCVAASELSLDDVTKVEGDFGPTTFAFTISVSPASKGPICVDIYTSDITATGGDDYVAVSTTVCIPAGVTSYVYNVTVNGDPTIELTETFTLNIINPTGGAVIADGSGLGTITNDDAVVPTLLQTFDASVSEDGITLRWQFANAADIAGSWLERSSAGGDVWTRVNGTVNEDGGMLMQTDPTAEAGQTYQYRLTAQMRSGQKVAFGPITVTAPAAMVDFTPRISPTPTRGLATIDFATARSERVKVSVLDLQGRQIETLLDGVVSPGRHSVTWDASRASTTSRAGLFFVRVETQSGKSYVKRLILAQ